MASLTTHVSRLKKETNRLVEVPEHLIDLAKQVKAQMEIFVVSSFLDYALATGILPYKYSVIPARLDEPTQQGLSKFFNDSYRPGSGLSPEHWRNKWLCVMSRSLYQVKLWGDKDRLSISGGGLLTYKYHLDLTKHKRFLKRELLRYPSKSGKFPYYYETRIPSQAVPRQLLTHATDADTIEPITSSGFIAPYQHITPVSLSEGVVSLPYSDKVFVFDPEVLKQAGHLLMRFDESRIDSDEILEVLEPLPVPVFLASGLFDTSYFRPRKAQSNAHVWSFAEPSAAFGHQELRDLQSYVLRSK